MKQNLVISVLFWLAAAYDGFLGLLFVIAPQLPFQVYAVAPPNHPGYVQFPGALLIIFAWMFCQVAHNPQRHSGLILYGIMLKAAYCAVVFWHWANSGIPAMWRQFAICDLVFLLLFAWAYRRLRCCAAGAESRPDS